MKKFTKFLLLAAAVVVAGCSGTHVTQQDVEQTLVVMNTNDHHGHPLNFFDYPAPGQGGLAARATLVNEIRDNNENVLVLDAGDFNTGRPESNFFKAEPDILGYNYVGYDAVAIGNHEFDVTAEDMARQIELSEFPWLCANVKGTDGKLLPGVEPYTIKDFGKFKVAILGLVDKGTEKTGSPAIIEGMTFEDEVEVANKWVPKLQKKADIVIALVHMGLYDDPERGSKRLARDVPGIAMIVDGHTHTKTEEPVFVKNASTGKDVPIVQSKQWGLYMGKTVLKFKNAEVTGVDFELVPVNVKWREKLADGSKVFHYVDKEIVEDEGLLEILTPYGDQVDAILSEEIGEATAPFLNDNSRKEETAIADLVADSMLWYAKSVGLEADFAFQNGGGVRTSMAEGPIQKQTVYEVLPFDNSVALVKMKGSDLRAIFDMTPANVGHGSMAQVSKGVSLTIDTVNGVVEELLINGEALDDNRVYNVVTNSYVAAGGDGYKPFKKNLEYYDTSLMQRDALIAYVQSLGGVISPVVEGRIILK